MQGLKPHLLLLPDPPVLRHLLSLRIPASPHGLHTWYVGATPFPRLALGKGGSLGANSPDEASDWG